MRPVAALKFSTGTLIALRHKSSAAHARREAPHLSVAEIRAEHAVRALFAGVGLHVGQLPHDLVRQVTLAHR